MFQSATLKLTAWYLLILMSISLIFSLVIHNIATTELHDRLDKLQTRFEHEADRVSFNIPLPDRLDYIALRNAQYEAASKNLAIQLIYVNLFILAIGGAGSYFLARRTLRPIEEAHEAQSQFVSDASHELKTPLAVMKTELEVALNDKNLKIGEAKELLRSNLEEVNKLSILSATLLLLSQLDHDSLEKEKVSLNDITKQIIKKYDKSGRRITFTASHKEYSVFANRTSLEELITILIDNALKYSPNKSLITIKTGKLNKNALFEITNTGKGIAATDLPHIFDRFYRADSARTKNSAKDGHGLGLSLAKRIVELHGGELSASSAPDHATTFTFLVPLFTKTPS
jgi:two-component system sensor histidine kinase CiaH